MHTGVRQSPLGMEGVWEEKLVQASATGQGMRPRSVTSLRMHVCLFCSSLGGAVDTVESFPPSILIK